MKKFLIAVTLIAFGAIFVNTEAQAQRYDESEYIYTDVNSGVIYQLYLKFSGYQVQVWMKNTQQAEWTAATVTSTSDEVISFKVGSTQYHAELDPNNVDAVVVYNGDYTNSWKYYQKQ